MGTRICFEEKYEKCPIFFSESFHFLVVKCSVYLNRRVFVMVFVRTSSMYKICVFTSSCAGAKSHPF